MQFVSGVNPTNLIVTFIKKYSHSGEVTGCAVGSFNRAATSIGAEKAMKGAIRFSAIVELLMANMF